MMPDMDWLKPIKERLKIMELIPLHPGQEPTCGDMLAADARKLLAVIGLADEGYGEALSGLNGLATPGEVAELLADCRSRLRSGEFQEENPMTVKEIIAGYLRQNGCDGLFSDDGIDMGCACHLDDLVPCGEDPSNCRPGYKVPCDCEEEHRFHMVKEKP